LNPHRNSSSRNASKTAVKRPLKSDTRSIEISSSESEDDRDDNNDQKLKLLQSIDWLKTFQPKEVSELAVHPKKVEDLRNWFKFLKIPNKILLIEGPTGAAKTAALRLIAKEQGFLVNEFINATDIEFDLLQEDNSNFHQRYENQSTKFSDFLLRSSRFDSLFDCDKQRLLMVKDFPNIFLKKVDEFWKILREYSLEGNSPLVFILTETNSKALNISYSLFPESIRLELSIDSIQFNAVSATMMKRGVKRIIQIIEGNVNYRPFFKRPSEEVVQDLIEQSCGDLRNCVLNLNFASSSSQFKISSVKKPAKRGAKKQKTTLKANDEAGIGKNEVVSLMHGLGRVFHPKLEFNESSKRMELTHKPETITESFQSQPSNFIKLIHSNYMKNFSDIDDVSAAADILSLSDCIESEYRDTNLSYVNLNLVIRSTMILNTSPAAGFRTISAYANKKFKNLEENRREKFASAVKWWDNGHMMTPKDFFCDHQQFVDIIKKHQS
jgi:cell cycle checkpoint protein